MAYAQTDEQSAMLMESGSLTAHNLGDVDGCAGASSGAEVRRGMLVQTSEGRTAGRVAAVVLDQEQQKVTHILLMRERQLLEYRLVPVELVEEVGKEAVLLGIFHTVVENLPIWHSK
jgi:sporulation protein YlmC with PRC-barrel domain